MKIYLGYKFSGEKYEDVINNLNKICSVLKSKGHTCYGLMDENTKLENSPREIFTKAFKDIDGCNVLLLFLNSNEKSEGMLIEAGYSKAINKKIVLAIKIGINSNLSTLTNDIVVFKDLEDLCDKLNNFNFNYEIN